jgi:FemAB-related protein (PEP-CTERM system-associated)
MTMDVALAADPTPDLPAADLDAPAESAPIVELADSASAWDDYVGRQPGATLYHLFAWKIVAEKAYGMRAPFLVVRDGPGQPIRGALPLVRVPRPFAPYLTTGLFGSYGRLLADDDRHARALIAAATRRIDDGDAAFLHLKLLGGAPAHPGLERHDVWVTAQLDLGHDAGALWTRLRSHMRTKIRQAQRAGLVAEHGAAGLDSFYEVLSGNMARKGAPIYGRRFMRVLLDALGPRGDVVLLRHEGRVVSGALVASFDRTMVVPFASSRASAFRLHANNLLYWEIAKRALGLGLRTLDFGSSLRGSTGLAFKESWKPRVEPIGSYVYSPGSTAPALAPADSALARMAVKIWAHVPAPVAQALGPQVCRWIA